jgi:hypothetical protein
MKTLLIFALLMSGCSTLSYMKKGIFPSDADKKHVLYSRFLKEGDYRNALIQLKELESLDPSYVDFKKLIPECEASLAEKEKEELREKRRQEFLAEYKKHKSIDYISGFTEGIKKENIVNAWGKPFDIGLKNGVEILHYWIFIDPTKNDNVYPYTFSFKKGKLVSFEKNEALAKSEKDKQFALLNAKLKEQEIAVIEESNRINRNKTPIIINNTPAYTPNNQVSQPIKTNCHSYGDYTKCTSY